MYKYILSMIEHLAFKSVSDFYIIICTLCFSLQSEYPKYTPLLAKILEGLVSRSIIEDKVLHEKEVV